MCSKAGLSFRFGDWPLYVWALVIDSFYFYLVEKFKAIVFKKRVQQYLSVANMLLNFFFLILEFGLFFIQGFDYVSTFLDFTH